jgi:hypothetical protein
MLHGHQLLMVVLLGQMVLLVSEVKAVQGQLAFKEMSGQLEALVFKEMSAVQAQLAFKVISEQLEPLVMLVRLARQGLRVILEAQARLVLRV